MRVCTRRSERKTHLVEERNVEGSTTSSDEVMRIAVEKVGKKLLARVPVSIGDNNQVVLTCQLDTAVSCNVMSKGTIGS